MRNKLGQYIKGHIPANKGSKFPIVCGICKKVFEVYPYRKDIAMFCSRKCAGKWQSTKTGERAPCWKGGKVKLICKNCGKEYERHPRDVGSSNYCSTKCTLETLHIKGEGNHNYGRKRPDKAGANNNTWKGGVTTENEKFRRTVKYKLWRNSIFERDDFTCQICGKRGVTLRANHIKKFADYPELRLIKSNGITICDDCDTKLVMYHEPEWESYFNFNLETRRGSF